MVMKLNFHKLLLVIIGFLLCLSSCKCSLINVKLAPEYKGVDPAIQPYVNEYKELAKIQGITFKNDVTIGFKKINEGNVVGICTISHSWREIDINEIFWNNSTPVSKLALLWHEFSHCYCGRKHDYSKDKEYSLNTGGLIDQMLERLGDKENPGFYSDFCPTSVLYPVVLDGQCFLSHYTDYAIEMFQRCESW